MEWWGRRSFKDVFLSCSKILIFHRIGSLENHWQRYTPMLSQLCLVQEWIKSTKFLICMLGAKYEGFLPSIWWNVWNKCYEIYFTLTLVREYTRQGHGKKEIDVQLTIHLAPPLTGGMHIFVKTFASKIITFEMELLDTIDITKAKRRDH